MNEDHDEKLSAHEQATVALGCAEREFAKAAHARAGEDVILAAALKLAEAIRAEEAAWNAVWEGKEWESKES